MHIRTHTGQSYIIIIMLDWRVVKYISYIFRYINYQYVIVDNLYFFNALQVNIYVEKL